MNFRKLLPSATTLLLFAGLVNHVEAQQTASTVPAGNAPPSVVIPLSEQGLRDRYNGKVVFLRGGYLGDVFHFDRNGKITGAPAVGSFTLSAFEVRNVTLSKDKLLIEADRYGLHFRAALPFEDETEAYDRVKISNRPVHITIEREPGTAKKKKKDQPAAADPANSPNPGDVAMDKALENVFATEFDPRLIAEMPAYWQGYFACKRQHRLFRPADSSIKVLADGMTPPTAMNRIEPDSNDFAQQHGIAGMEMLRTVVDATGVPQEIAISRPIGFGLDEAAAEAVRRSRFTPAMVHGQPIPVIIDLVVTFRIYSSRTDEGPGGKKQKAGLLSASVADSVAAR